MRSHAALITLLVATVALIAPQPVLAMAATRHDGTVERVDAKAQTLVIREYGRGGHATDFHVRLTPNARITLSERNARAIDAKHEFTQRPTTLSAIRRGDFVVLDVTGHGKQQRAESVTVTLRNREGSTPRVTRQDII